MKFVAGEVGQRERRNAIESVTQSCDFFELLQSPSAVWMTAELRGDGDQARDRCVRFLAGVVANDANATLELSDFPFAKGTPVPLRVLDPNQPPVIDAQVEVWGRTAFEGFAVARGLL